MAYKPDSYNPMGPDFAQEATTAGIILRNLEDAVPIKLSESIADIAGIKDGPENLRIHLQSKFGVFILEQSEVDIKDVSTTESLYGRI